MKVKQIPQMPEIIISAANSKDSKSIEAWRFETNQRLTNYLEMYWGSSEKSAHRIFNTKPNIIQKTVWQKYAKIWEKYGKV